MSQHKYNAKSLASQKIVGQLHSIDTSMLLSHAVWTWGVPNNLLVLLEV